MTDDNETMEEATQTVDFHLHTRLPSGWTVTIGARATSVPELLRLLSEILDALKHMGAEPSPRRGKR